MENGRAGGVCHLNSGPRIDEEEINRLQTASKSACTMNVELHR